VIEKIEEKKDKWQSGENKGINGRLHF